MNEIEEKVPLVNGEKVFMKATGPNRFGEGSPNWLLIRGIKKTGEDSYDIRVRIKGKDMVASIVDPRYGRKDLKFVVKSGKQITFDQLLKSMGMPTQLKLFKESKMFNLSTELDELIEKFSIKITDLFDERIAPYTRNPNTKEMHDKVKSLILQKLSKSMNKHFIQNVGVNEMDRFIREEVHLAIEDLIRPLTEKTLTSNIAGEINPENNKYIESVFKTSFISSGAVTFVVGVDKQQYEIVVRPLRLGQFKDMVSDVKNENT